MKQTHPAGQSVLPLQLIVVGSGSVRTQSQSTVPAKLFMQEQQSSPELQGHCCSVPNASQTSELPQMKQPPLTHIALLAHVQSIVPPQVSESVPHRLAGHVDGVQQLPWLQTCSCVHVESQVPAATLQIWHWPVGHSPQTSVPPQPSEMVPQRPEQVAGRQQFPS